VTSASRGAAAPDARGSGGARLRGPLSAWLAFKRLTRLGFPQRFPIVQFPNLPLILGVLAGQLGDLIGAGPHPYLVSVSYVAVAIWAYEELADGVNWFRRLLGLTFLIIVVIRVAHAIQA
jgi:hypothetical protein